MKLGIKDGSPLSKAFGFETNQHLWKV